MNRRWPLRVRMDSGEVRELGAGAADRSLAGESLAPVDRTTGGEMANLSRPVAALGLELAEGYSDRNVDHLWLP